MILLAIISAASTIGFAIYFGYKIGYHHRKTEAHLHMYQQGWNDCLAKMETKQKKSREESTNQRVVTGGVSYPKEMLN